VLPMAPANTVLSDHAVAVEGGKILGLGPVAEMRQRFDARDRVVRREHALMPGFVNAHTRAARTLLRGLPVRGPRARWLRNTVLPIEQRCMNADFVREGTQLAVAEMLRAGITSFADMNLFPEEAARVASAARMRAAIGLPVSDAPNVWADSATAHFERAEHLWDDYRSHRWVCLYFAPQEAEVSDDTLIRLRRVADELDARVAMEAPPLRRLHALGLLRPGFAGIAHSAWSADDAELVATTGIAVIRCLQGDLRLGAGGGTGDAASQVAPVVVGLGSGDPVSAGALDMLAEARIAALLSGGAVSASDALRMATLGGATALGFAADTGSIEPGKYADLICVDLNRLACQPASSVTDCILFGATREQVSDVWTSGRLAVSKGQLLGFDEHELQESVLKWEKLRSGT